MSHAEIARRYRPCPGGAEKTRWQILRLATRPDEPMSAGRAALAVEPAAAWGRAILKRYNAKGADGPDDGRRANGIERVPTEERRCDPYDAPQSGPPDGGVWTGPKVARYVRDRWGVEVVPRTGWRWLRRLGFALRAPRPRHPKAATAERRKGRL